MRFRDYVRLGRISLKNRKKSTRNTVCGISFGLTLLVAVLFFTLSFSVDLMNAINEARSVSCFAIPVTNELDAQDGMRGSTRTKTLPGLIGEYCSAIRREKLCTVCSAVRSRKS